MSISGFATPEGTKAYSQWFVPHGLNAGAYGPLGDWTVSSLGLGTYLGQPDPATSSAYAESLKLALGSGLNLVDSAINYRHQLSERAVGTALAQAIGAKEIKREEVVVCTKGGFIALDATSGLSAKDYFQQEYVATGIIQSGEVAGGMHCMAPDFVKDQVRRSLTNLGLERIDLYYLHNPETQAMELAKPEFLKRLRLAFEALEAEAQAGRLTAYGVATWDGFRSEASEPGHLELEEVLALAREVGGAKHGFKAIQLPYNIAMAEALLEQTQTWAGQKVCLLEAADKAGISVIASASLLQGKLAQGLPDMVSKAFPEAQTNSQKAIQFTRSAPGISAALVGASHAGHVVENLGVMKFAKASQDALAALFASGN